MLLQEDKALFVSTKIFLFDDNLNLFQGGHAFQSKKTQNKKKQDKYENKENYNKINIINIENENEGNQYNKNNTSSSIKKKPLDNVGKEIDLLLNTFYDKEFENTQNFIIEQRKEIL